MTVKEIWKVKENMIQSFTGEHIKLTMKDVGILQIPGAKKIDVLKINGTILIGKLTVTKIKDGSKKILFSSIRA